MANELQVKKVLRVFENRPTRFWIGWVLVVCFLNSAGCQNEKEGSPAESKNARRQVYVVNYPLEYMAKRISDSEVNVVFPLPKDIDPAYWQATSRVIADFQGADVVLLNGATYSKWLSSVSLPESKLVDTSEGFADQYIKMEDSFIHKHGPEGEHSHAGIASTTWLDLAQAKLQAHAIKESLKNLLPSRERVFEENFSHLAKELEELDQGFVSVGKKLAGQPLVFSHPVYQYFSRRYGLNKKSVLWEPDVLPDEKAIDELEKILVNHAARYMIWENEPLDATRELLAKKFNMKCVVICPCFNLRDEKTDWLETMKQNLKSLESISHAQ